MAPWGRTTRARSTGRGTQGVDLTADTGLGDQTETTPAVPTKGLVSPSVAAPIYPARRGPTNGGACPGASRRAQPTAGQPAEIGGNRSKPPAARGISALSYRTPEGDGAQGGGGAAGVPPQRRGRSPSNAAYGGIHGPVYYNHAYVMRRGCSERSPVRARPPPTTRGRGAQRAEAAAPVLAPRPGPALLAQVLRSSPRSCAPRPGPALLDPRPSILALRPSGPGTRKGGPLSGPPYRRRKSSGLSKNWQPGTPRTLEVDHAPHRVGVG